MLQDKITETKSAAFKQRIPDMLECIKSTMDLIEDMSETHNKLLKDAFSALLTAPKTHFMHFFECEKMLWEAKKHCDYDTLDSIVKIVCNNVHSNKSWNAVDPKDAKIIALRAEINDVRKKLKKAKETNKKGGISGAPDHAIKQ